MEIGQRIRVNKSDPDQDQLIDVGERGTLVNFYVEDNYHIIMEIELDSGERLTMDNTTFRFDMYNKIQ